MLRYKMAPAFDVHELERALCEEYGPSFEKRYDYELTSFFFGDEYNNDSFKRLYIDSIDSGNDEYSETFNIIIQFLRERIPEDTKYVLIDVSW
mgnify:CR=1 FL=1